MEVLKIAGKPENAPANKPKPLELIQLLMKIQKHAARPRKMCIYHLTWFFPFGVGGRDQHRMKPNTTQINIMVREKVKMGTERDAVHSSNQVMNTAATNQAIKEMKRVKNTIGVFFIFFSSRAGRIFQMGRKTRFVARMPILCKLNRITLTNGCCKERFCLLLPCDSRLR